MKRCYKCKETKRFEDFGGDKSKPDGYNRLCRSCTKAKDLAWRLKNPEKYLARSRRSNKRQRRTTEQRRVWNNRYARSEKGKAVARKYSRTEKGKANLRRSAQRVRWPQTILRSYGLTVEAYAWMLHSQNFCCAICNNALPTEVIGPRDSGNKERPCVDHCHKSGVVRGILCSGCNYAVIGPLERGGDLHLIRTLHYLGWAIRPKTATVALRLLATGTPCS